MSNYKHKAHIDIEQTDEGLRTGVDVVADSQSLLYMLWILYCHLGESAQGAFEVIRSAAKFYESLDEAHISQIVEILTGRDTPEAEEVVKTFTAIWKETKGIQSKNKTTGKIVFKS